MESIRVTGIIPASPERVYHAWLSSDEHTSFTGKRKAIIDPQVGGTFSAHDGHITGKTLDLKKNRKIVQSWRDTKFPPDAPDSRLEILLKRREDGTSEITLIHTGIPVGQGQLYQSGWLDRYLIPMRSYFGSLSKDEKGAAKRMADLEAKKAEKKSAEQASQAESQKRAAEAALRAKAPAIKKPAAKSAKPAVKTAQKDKEKAANAKTPAKIQRKKSAGKKASAGRGR